MLFSSSPLAHSMASSLFPTLGHSLGKFHCAWWQTPHLSLFWDPALQLVISLNLPEKQLAGSAVVGWVSHLPEVSKPRGRRTRTWSWVNPPGLSWELLPPVPGLGGGMAGPPRKESELKTKVGSPASLEPVDLWPDVSPLLHASASSVPRRAGQDGVGALGAVSA